MRRKKNEKKIGENYKRKKITHKISHYSKHELSQHIQVDKILCLKERLLHNVKQQDVCLQQTYLKQNDGNVDTKSM